MAKSTQSITPPKYFYSRRKFLNYLTSLGSFFYLTSKSQSSFSNAIGNLHKNDSFINKRPLTNEKFATTYNNFYEFGSSKNIWRSASEGSTVERLLNRDSMSEIRSVNSGICWSPLQADRVKGAKSLPAILLL